MQTCLYIHMIKNFYASHRLHTDKIKVTGKHCIHGCYCVGKLHSYVRLTAYFQMAKYFSTSGFELDKPAIVCSTLDSHYSLGPE